MRISRSFPAILLCQLLFGPSLALGQAAVSSCGQVLTEDAVLAGDLDCTGSGVALTLEGVQLDLAGFSILGADIECLSQCRVVGPGTIAGLSGRGPAMVGNLTATGALYASSGIRVSSSTILASVGSAARTDLKASTVTGGTVSGDTLKIENSVVDGGSVDGRVVQLIESAIRNSPQWALSCESCYVERSEITDNGSGGVNCYHLRTFGLTGHRWIGKLEMFGSRVSGNGFEGTTGNPTSAGIHCAQRALVSGSVVSGNNRGLVVDGDSQTGNGARTSYRRYGIAMLEATEVTDNESSGVTGIRKTLLEQSTVSGNGCNGAAGSRQLVVIDSSVTDNGTADTADDCADLWSKARPQLRGSSTCGVSDGNPDDPIGSWEVCALD